MGITVQGFRGSRFHFQSSDPVSEAYMDLRDGFSRRFRGSQQGAAGPWVGQTLRQSKGIRVPLTVEYRETPFAGQGRSRGKASAASEGMAAPSMVDAKAISIAI